MNLQLIGVNHRTAPVEIRERFAVPEKKLPEALQSLVQYPGVQEGLIVSTCNRVEVLAGLKNGTAICGLPKRLLPSGSLRIRPATPTSSASTKPFNTCSASLPALTPWSSASHRYSAR